MHRFITWFNCLKVRFKSKRFIIPFIFALTLLFFPKDAFALTISNVQFLDNSNNVTATYTKSDIDNGIIGKDEPFLATKMRFNFTNSGIILLLILIWLVIGFLILFLLLVYIAVLLNKHKVINGC